MTEFIATSHVHKLPSEIRKVFEENSIKAFPLQPGAVYGPFYHTGAEVFRPVVDNPPNFANGHQTFLGFQKPKSKEEAIELYNLRPDLNPLEWVHEIEVHVPATCSNATLFVGPVNGGSGIQVLMNKPASKCARSIRKTHLDCDGSRGKGYII
jgi:hypothetical protein